MSNWEYKAISSGKGGFATPALMEKFLNDLGQEEWEIIEFRTPPDNPLAFTGLARRSTQRDWTLQDAAAAAARAEADKLRAEFEAKFKAATSNGPAAAEEKGETFLAEEKVDTDDGLRRVRDTSRDDDRDAPEDENGEKDDWDKLAEEDELPTFFDALKPHMRRNQRGPGMSVGVDFLAKKWRLEESDIKGALVECGLQIPADENARPVYVEYDGDLYWVNINRRGEIWINTREKPEPVFRVVQGRRLTEEESAATETTGGGSTPRETPRREAPPAREPRQNEGRPQEAAHAPQQQQQPATPKTFLDKVRSLMRRNRRGHGWSGSFGFLTKAFKTDEAGLLAQLAEHGVTMAPEGSDKPLFHEEGDFLYWMNKNQRGEIWINARKERRGGGAPEADEPEDEAGGQETAPAESAGEPIAAPAPVATDAPVETPAAASTAEPAPAPENTLSAVRLLLEPKKRGEGVTALVANVAQQLGRSEETLLAALTAAGLNVPEDAKTKPTFGENAGEIFWLNRSAKGDLWLNAKASKAKKARAKKSEDDAEE
ncbi:MAG TPA: hypothetical protein VFJ90_02675 [Candidatus Didemnitutus sp.]|nr:hypothetical protein [Candidatus Didemnitutus sp.]